MGISQIEAGKAYVAIYGDKRPLVESMKQLAPEIRAQGDALAKIGESTASAFNRGTVEVMKATEGTKDATIAFNIAAIASSSFSAAADKALTSTAASSKLTATATQQIVTQMEKAQPATKGFATAFASLKSADVTLANGAFGVSSLITLLRGGGEATKPLLDGLTGIVGKAQQISKIKPPSGKKSAAAFDNTALVGDGAGLPFPSTSGSSTSTDIGSTISGIAAKLNQTYQRIYNLIQSRKIQPAGQSGSTKLYDQTAIDALAKAIDEIDAKKSKEQPSERRTAREVLSRIHDKIRQAAKGSTANMMGLQTIYEGAVQGGTKVANAVGNAARAALTRVAPAKFAASAQAAFDVVGTAGKAAYEKVSAAAAKLANSERARFAAGAAAGAAAGTVVGTVKGATQSLMTMGKLASVVGVNLIGGLSGIKGAFAPAFGQLTAMQKVANRAQWATLFVGSKQQRMTAKQMGLEADAAAVGEAFARGWVPGFLKYAQVGIPRALSSVVRGTASVPRSIVGGTYRFLFGARGEAAGVDAMGNATAGAASKMGLLQRAVDGVNKTAAKTGGLLSGITKGMRSIAMGAGGALLAIAALTGKGNGGAVKRIEEVGVSAATNKRSVESTSELDFAATATGTSLKTLDKAFDGLESKISKANDGNEKAIKTFNALGISADKLGELKIDEQMSRVGAALANIRDPLERDRLAMDLLGESGHELVPMLTDLAGLRDKAKSSGAVLSVQDVEAAKAMSQAMAQLKAVLTNAWNQIGAASIRSTTSWVSGATQFISNNQKILTSLLKIAAGISAGAGAFVLFQKFGPPVLRLVSALGGLVMGLMNPIGLVVLGIGAGVAAWMYFTSSGRATATALGNNLARLGQFFSEVWGGIVAAVGKGDLALAGNIAWTALQIGFLTALNAMGISWTSTMGVIYTAMDVVTSAITEGWAFVATQIRSVQNVIAKTMIALTDGIGTAWAQLWSSIQQGAISTQMTVANTMTKLIGKALGKSDKEITVMQAGLGVISGVLSGQVEEKRKKAIPPDIEAQIQAADDAANKDKSTIEANRKASREAQKNRFASQMSGLQPDDERRNKLQAQLDAMVTKAKEQENDPKKMPGKFVPDDPMESGGKGSAAGTFAAAAAAGLGGPKTLEKIAMWQERTVAEISQLRREAAKKRREKAMGGVVS